jgi:hypothetical protein
MTQLAQLTQNALAPFRFIEMGKPVGGPAKQAAATIMP